MVGYSKSNAISPARGSEKDMDPPGLKQQITFGVKVAGITGSAHSWPRTQSFVGWIVSALIGWLDSPSRP